MSIDDAVRAFEAALPRHKCGLHITHNQHRDYYQTVEQYLAECEADDEEISPVERARAAASGELWEIQWYPDTPVGSYKVYASTLADALLAAAMRVDR